MQGRHGGVRTSSTAMKFLVGLLIVLVSNTMADSSCYLFPGKIIGLSQIDTTTTATAASCCSHCSSLKRCMSWTWHSKTRQCFSKDNANVPKPPLPADNNTVSGLTSVAPTCAAGSLCPEGSVHLTPNPRALWTKLWL